LSTTEGWFKAQLLFHTLKQPPPSGSLQEWVLLLYLDRMEDIEHAKFRALVQTLLAVGADNHETSIQAFEDYMNKAFPNLSTKKKKKHEQMVDVLKHWVSQGPIGVTPLSNPDQRMRSKMVKHISSVEKGAVARATAKIGGLRPR
jgi:hypothetical protein